MVTVGVPYAINGGPTITVQGPSGETARVLVAKGFIVPFTNEFPDSDPFHAQLDAQIAALEASGFPANNAVEMLYVDVALDGSVQDISSLFDFTQVPQFDRSVTAQTNEFGELNEGGLPLGIVASVIDPATDQSLGPVTSPIHLTFEGNDPPDIDPIDDITIDETQEAAFLINATDPEGDPVTLSVAVVRDSDSAVVDPGDYTFIDTGDGPGSFSWLTDDADGGPSPVPVTADDTFSQSQEVLSLTVNDPGVELFGAAVLTVNNGNNDIEGSNFGDGSWAISNVGDKNIAFIEIDVTDALFPDAVFDPFGLAGDQLGKLFSPNGGDGGTGLVIPVGGFDEDAIGITYLGAGGSEGFEKVRLEFTDFNPGETLNFSIDMDPNSIAGAIKSTLDSGAVLAGAGQWDVGGVGGAELAGSLFTVGYTDATESTGQLQGQGTGGQMGAEAARSPASPRVPSSAGRRPTPTPIPGTRSSRRRSRASASSMTSPRPRPGRRSTSTRSGSAASPRCTASPTSPPGSPSTGES